MLTLVTSLEVDLLGLSRGEGRGPCPGRLRGPAAMRGCELGLLCSCGDVGMRVGRSSAACAEVRETLTRPHALECSGSGHSQSHSEVVTPRPEGLGQPPLPVSRDRKPSAACGLPSVAGPLCGAQGRGCSVLPWPPVPPPTPTALGQVGPQSLGTCLLCPSPFPQMSERLAPSPALGCAQVSRLSEVTSFKPEALPALSLSCIVSP